MLVRLESSSITGYMDVYADVQVRTSPDTRQAPLNDEALKEGALRGDTCSR